MASHCQQQQGIRRQFNRLAQSGEFRRWASSAAAEGDLTWIPRTANARVLDVGCGSGAGFPVLARGAGLFAGLNLSDSMLHEAKRRGVELGAALTQADVHRLPFASGSFDLCFCAFCFAHFISPRNAIQEMVRVLCPGGLLAMLDVVASSPRQLLQVNRLERARDSCYTHIRELKSFVNLFSGLPLEWISRTTLRRAVSLQSWMAASALRTGSRRFVRAGREFRRAAAEQNVCSPGRLSSQPRYYYTAVRLLLRKQR